jgi:hypothetical protein
MEGEGMGGDWEGRDEGKGKGGWVGERRGGEGGRGGNILAPPNLQAKLRPCSSVFKRGVLGQEFYAGCPS